MSEPLKDKIVECPYDKSHRILKSRLQAHVVKCAAVHSGENMQVCPFNATHRVKGPLFQHHVATCEDRRIVELSKYCVDVGEMHGHLAIASYMAPIQPPDAERWDHDDAPTYDAGCITQDGEMIRSFHTMCLREQQSKVKRQAFRRDERLRVSNLQEGMPSSTENSFIPPSKPVAVLADNVPLRQPRERTYVGPINPRMGLGRGAAIAEALKLLDRLNQQPGLEPEDNMFRPAASFQQISVGRGTSVNSPNSPRGLKPVAVGRGVAIPYTESVRQPRGLRLE